MKSTLFSTLKKGSHIYEFIFLNGQSTCYMQPWPSVLLFDKLRDSCCPVKIIESLWSIYVKQLLINLFSFPKSLNLCNILYEWHLLIAMNTVIRNTNILTCDSIHMLLFAAWWRTCNDSKSFQGELRNSSIQMWKSNLIHLVFLFLLFRHKKMKGFNSSLNNSQWQYSMHINTRTRTWSVGMKVEISRTLS